MLIALHAMTLGEGVPDWVHLVPAGTFTGVDGRGPYTLKDAQAVINASGTEKLPLDENHATDFAGPAGQPSPARGWIVEMQARPDGIWGRVEWTQSGQALLADKAYRGISPVFENTKDGTVVRILRAALTNTPNLAQLKTLNSQETGMDLARLRAALGLPEAADEAAILAAAEERHRAAAAHSAVLARIAQAAGLDAAAAADQVVTSVQALRPAATEVQRMAATIAALEGQVTAMRQDAARAAATAFVDNAIRAGAPVNALRDHYIARHIADAAGVEKEINALPKLNVTSSGNTVVLHAAGDGADGLTDTDMSVAKKMGIDPKKFVAFKKKQADVTDGRAA